MNFNEYTEFVISMMSDASMKDDDSKMLTAALGLAGEAGEFVDIIKKIKFQGLDKSKNLIDELGDIMFYLTFAISQVADTNIEHIMEENCKKLKKRYRDGFSVSEFAEKEKLKTK